MNTLPRIAALVALLTACQGSTHTSAAPPATAKAQAERGARLFAANCAKCHGDSGQGSDDAPPLVGPGALPLAPRKDQKRQASFHTALDVAQFVTQQMPPKASARATLSSDDYWAILGFALGANGVALKEPVGPDGAAAIVLHP